MRLDRKDNKWFVRTPELVEEVQVVFLKKDHTNTPTFKLLTHAGQIFHSIDNPQFTERLFDNEDEALEYAYKFGESRLEEVQKQMDKLVKELEKLKKLPEVGVEI